MSVLSQSHSIIINKGISAPGHEKEVVDVPNAIDKRYIYQSMSNVQLTGSRTFESQILAHQKSMSVWLKNYKNICLIMIVDMEPLIRKNTGKYPVKENGQTESIMFSIMSMLHTKM